MKAIIPVAGAGTKLRPHSYTQPKALIPLAGKTVLSIIIEQLQQAGIQEFVFIVGYLGDKIHDYVEAKHPGIKAHYIHQGDRQGIGHAIRLTRNFVNNDEVFVVLGDTICEYNVREVVESPVSMIGVRKVDDPRDFGVAEIDTDSVIHHVVEKPQIPKSNMAMVGIYKIKETEQMFQCLENNIRQGLKSHGEYSLTDALDCMIQLGVKFKSFKVENWFDCGKKETMLESNATLLKKFAKEVNASQFENTVIIPPVSIGENCKVKNSIIGPNVAIGEHTVLDSCIVKNSIIGSFSNLFDIVLDDSVIGSDSNLRGETRSLNIGDNTSIDLG
ncbi:MAG TPA: sugar phosphate nucleotidyltransferase [Chitinophagaceae bacterium]|nr:sugar phosphate nucleotidyltransferase [Chitinophagaceae bacterium]HMX77960.1 sugar phosphate nucleotidyltransferase [Chitinophagaceae bacterium]HNF46100.1 sugar phosphate nucleotidyltransferase [Chitinophagaceae bacterium]HNK60704.1 sugar phosphate nucleotidyltransferase [Chitinophagaceae bacterium]HNL59503.1 sugar phosphate nucleotidyltransferase [Chitinophagaceae bacterium]